MELDDLYTDIITEHSRSTKNKRKIEDASVTKRGHNPSCGDDITLDVKIIDSVIVDIAFSGIGCAISTASTSIMIDILKGKTVKEALEYIDTFLKMIKREITSEDELLILEEAMAFKNISNMPARVKCAVIAWHTLKEALEK